MIISQREARKLRKQVAEFERREWERGNAWCVEWPNGVNIGQVNLAPADFGRIVGAILTARKLKHAVVATVTENGLLNLHALPLAGKP